MGETQFVCESGPAVQYAAANGSESSSSHAERTLPAADDAPTWTFICSNEHVSSTDDAHASAAYDSTTFHVSAYDATAYDGNAATRHSANDDVTFSPASNGLSSAASHDVSPAQFLWV